MNNDLAGRTTPMTTARRACLTLLLFAGLLACERGAPSDVSAPQTAKSPDGPRDHQGASPGTGWLGASESLRIPIAEQTPLLRPGVLPCELLRPGFCPLGCSFALPPLQEISLAQMRLVSLRQDGNLDLLLRDRRGAFHVLQGQGSGELLPIDDAHAEELARAFLEAAGDASPADEARAAKDGALAAVFARVASTVESLEPAGGQPRWRVDVDQDRQLERVQLSDEGRLIIEALPAADGSGARARAAKSRTYFTGLGSGGRAAGGPSRLAQARLEVGDINGDGDLDMLVFDGLRLALMFGMKRGFYAPRTGETPPAVRKGLQVQLGDAGRRLRARGLRLEVERTKRSEPAVKGEVPGWVALEGLEPGGASIAALALRRLRPSQPAKLLVLWPGSAQEQGGLQIYAIGEESEPTIKLEATLRPESEEGFAQGRLRAFVVSDVNRDGFPDVLLGMEGSAAQLFRGARYPKFVYTPGFRFGFTQPLEEAQIEAGDDRPALLFRVGEGWAQLDTPCALPQSRVKIKSR